MVLIEHLLPELRREIRLPIQQPPVAQNYGLGGAADIGYVGDDILQPPLNLHEGVLKIDHLVAGVLHEVQECSSRAQDGGCFGNDEGWDVLLLEQVVNPTDAFSFAATSTSGIAYGPPVRHILKASFSRSVFCR